MVLVVLQNCLEVIKQDSAPAIFPQIYVRTQRSPETGISPRDITLNKCSTSRLHVWMGDARIKKKPSWVMVSAKAFLLFGRNTITQAYVYVRRLHMWSVLLRNEKSSKMNRKCCSVQTNDIHDRTVRRRGASEGLAGSQSFWVSVCSATTEDRGPKNKEKNTGRRFAFLV